MHALRLELGRGGGSDEAPYLSDPDSAATVEVAHTLKEVGMELVDAFREVTGHPRLKGAFHELRGTTGTTRTRTPILPKGVPEGSPAPPALPAAAPVPEAPGEGSIFKDHPEAGDALERILELAPVIYRFTTQRGKMPTEQLLGYVEKDAAAKARGAWLIASDKLPLHDWDATSMSCSRCKAPKNEENLYADCPKGTTQKDMLRRLGGKTVENLIELLGKYSQSVELTKPVDALGGMSLNKFFMERKWERGNLTLDLGGMTIYHCVLQTDEGLHWVGRFLTEITALVETESRPGVP
jgi:hypothetical protein